MIRHPCSVRRPRRGFTLIEMLVAVSIIILVASLTALILPNLQEKQRVQTGASDLQNWLLTAKQWALRDAVPRGVRFQLDASSGGLLVRTMQYLEQPEDFTGGYIQVNATVVTLSTYAVDFAGSPPPPQPPAQPPAIPPIAQWPIQNGDLLLVNNDINQLFRITLNATTPTSLTIDRPATAAIPWTSDYKIIRQPRPRTGETLLELPQNIVLDLQTNNAWYGNYIPLQGTAPSQYFDILFAPSGEVIGWTGGTTRIQLWLRDASEDATGNQTFNGKQFIVTVNVRSGLISTNPVDETPDLNATPPGSRYKQPYSFTQDGRSTGT